MTRQEALNNIVDRKDELSEKEWLGLRLSMVPLIRERSKKVIMTQNQTLALVAQMMFEKV